MTSHLGAEGNPVGPPTTTENWYKPVSQIFHLMLIVLGQACLSSAPLGFPEELNGRRG